MNNSNPRFFIGIDWGEKMSGIAAGDDVLKIATAMGEVATKDVFEEVLKRKREGFQNEVILGIGKDFEESKRKKIGKLKKSLEKKGFIVHFENEDFSSIIAQKNLRSAGKKGVSKKDNAEAARIILQSWLDKIS